MEKLKILILASNPWETQRLGLDEEYQRIQELWESSGCEDRFELRYYPALRGEALQEKVLKFKPHLIHFSGHGENDSLVFADLSGEGAYEVTKQALAQLFKLCAPNLKAVFLNACHSAKQAEAIVEQVEYVVGMNAAINDLAAVSFSQGFYTAIFSQTAVDIEQAFNAGLTQMAIAQICEAEQKKPMLQKRRQPYVPGYLHDVFINFADDDVQWANSLIDYLRKQFKQKLGTADGFQLHSGNDFSQLEQSATLLIIASPAYCRQYPDKFEQLSQFSKQQPVFLAEHEVCSPRPEVLKAFTPHKFWYYDDTEGMMSLAGDGYFAKADELISAIAKRLSELRNQSEHQQRLDQQRQQQQDTREQKPNSQSIDAFVFLHSAPEDLGLTSDIVSLLEKNGIDYVLPLERSSDVTASDVRQDIENNILNCDAVLILYDQTTPMWVREQLGTCRRLQRKRDAPLKSIAVQKSIEKPDLNYQLDNLCVYPKKTPADLAHFIETLT